MKSLHLNLTLDINDDSKLYSILKEMPKLTALRIESMTLTQNYGKQIGKYLSDLPTIQSLELRYAIL